MNKWEIRNTVEKRFLGDLITYLFPAATVIVNTTNNSLQFFYFTNNAQVKPNDTVLFTDLDDNFGTADAEAYADYLADNSFFFDDASSGGGTSDVNIVSQSAGLALESKQDLQITEAEETNELLSGYTEDFTAYEKRILAYTSNVVEELRKAVFLLSKLNE